jgi:two-component system, response regulator
MNNKSDLNEKFVLLVEDNEDDVVLTQSAFKKCGISHKLEVVNDGQDALDFLFGEGKYVGRDTSRLPAVMILDLKLPYVSGVEVLRRVRMESTPLCRLNVVLLTSSLDQQEIDKCEKMGIFRYYRKPDNFPAFQKLIEEIRGAFLLKDGAQSSNGNKREGIIIPNRAKLD